MAWTCGDQNIWRIESRFHATTWRTRMHSIHCSGCLSCRACPLHAHSPAMHAPCHAHPLQCMPPCHACPLPCVSPCHTRPPCHAFLLPLWTEFLTHACENIIFPLLRLRTVTMHITRCNGPWVAQSGHPKLRRALNPRGDQMLISPEVLFL